MIRIALLFSLASCQQPARSAPANITNAACMSGCSSSLECGDALSRCRYCYLGKCGSVLPAEPVKDAGIDAAPGGTTP